MERPPTSGRSLEKRETQETNSIVPQSPKFPKQPVEGPSVVPGPSNEHNQKIPNRYSDSATTPEQFIRKNTQVHPAATKHPIPVELLLKTPQIIPWEPVNSPTPTPRTTSVRVSIPLPPHFIPQETISKSAEFKSQITHHSKEDPRKPRKPREPAFLFIIGTKREKSQRRRRKNKRQLQTGPY